MKVAIFRTKYYIMCMNRFKKIAHIIKLVLLGAKIARLIINFGHAETALLSAISVSPARRKVRGRQDSRLHRHS